MSCGLNPKQEEVLNKLTTLSSADGILGIIDVLPFTFPTTGQGIAEAVGLGPQYAEIAAGIKEIESFLSDIQNGLIPDELLEALPPELRESVKSFHQDAKDLYNKLQDPAAAGLDFVLQGEGLANEVDRLKTKWGDIDAGAGGIEGVVDLIKSGSMDLKNICKKLDNLKKSADGLLTIFGGTPLTAPDEDPSNSVNETPAEIPETVIPEITQDVERRVDEILSEFENIEEPKLLNKLKLNEKMRTLQQITGSLGL